MNESRQAPKRLGDLPLDDMLRDPLRKQSFVTPMFDRIASRYDAFTRLFSFGMDAGWKRDVVTTVTCEAPHARTALDLACGTGDLAAAVARALPAVRVLGLDASPRMVQEAVARLANTLEPQRVTVAEGDMMSLHVADASMDLVTVGYGVRNVPVARTAIREMARVLRPGGLLVTLDFYRPENAWWRRPFLAYLSIAGRAVGWLWHRDPIVYGYIARSIDHFMSWQAMSNLLADEGFHVLRVDRHLMGAIAMHVAMKA